MFSKTLITGIRSLQNEIRKDARERMYRECVIKDGKRMMKEIGGNSPSYIQQVAYMAAFVLRFYYAGHSIRWYRLVPDGVHSA